jgi:succinyl-diaminopimelate desuccinylase
VIPDVCQITVNFRFAPDRSIDDASEHLREYLGDFEGINPLEIEIVDAAPAARPNLDHPLVQSFVESVAAPPQPKLGWTDVARFAELGVPAVNFGPGDPEIAHTREEHVVIERIGAAETVLVDFLGRQA